ncbi:MAG: efflux RND transporter permease subunit [Gemmatimonadaceae bacterium]|nr:efflux RND transporter permease subunit [Gemmatimonadaceae bacterium]
MKSANSEAQDGFAQITTEFEFSKPLRDATQEIRDAIGANSGTCREEMEVILRRFNGTDAPIVTLSRCFSTSLTPAQLTLIADPGITRELRSIPQGSRRESHRRGENADSPSISTRSGCGR